MIARETPSRLRTVGRLGGAVRVTTVKLSSSLLIPAADTVVWPPRGPCAIADGVTTFFRRQHANTLLRAPAFQGCRSQYRAKTFCLSAVSTAQPSNNAHREAKPACHATSCWHRRSGRQHNCPTSKIRQPSGCMAVVADTPVRQYHNLRVRDF